MRPGGSSPCCHLPLLLVIVLACCNLSLAQIPTQLVPCVPGQADTYGQCGFKGGIFRPCASAEDVCVRNNDHHSQCRPILRAEKHFESRNDNTTVQYVCSEILGGSKENPLQGPVTLKALGVETVPASSPGGELVKPYWLNFSDPVAAACSACDPTPKYILEGGNPMFVYTDLCFMQQPDVAQTVTVRTKRGPDGPNDTTLFVYNEARTVGLWDDFGFLVCSDGSHPADRACEGEGGCLAGDERCPEGETIWSMSEVQVPVAAGTVPECFKVAIGANPNDGKVGNVGIDVLNDITGRRRLASTNNWLFGWL